MFGFLGGITGVIMGTEQINIIMHNTLYVPGHFHATVVAGTTLTFMAVSYFLVPVLFRRELWLPGLAKWQTYIYGLGVAGISVFMMAAGTLGVSRRHLDNNFADATLGFDYPAAAHMFLALNGLSGLLAGVGGASFCIIMVGTILWGKKKSDAPATEPAPAPEPAAHSAGSAGTIAVPGTFVLALIFLGSFILYYYVNWKYLAEVWGLS
jgi:cytochrome c oxidase subunit 1